MLFTFTHYHDNNDDNDDDNDDHTENVNYDLMNSKGYMKYRWPGGFQF